MGNQTQIELTIEDGQIVGATSRVNAALQSIEDKAKHLGEHTGFDKFAEGVKGFIEDPLHSAGEAVESLLKGLGPMGTAAAAGFAALAIGAEKAVEVMEHLGELGVQTQNVSLKTGLLTSEVGQFAFAAKAVGGDITSVERLMRGLTMAIEGTDEKSAKARETLKGMGVDMAGLKEGTASTSETLMKISEGLNAMPNVWDRNKVALDLFKRAGIDAIPMIIALNENLKKAHELGLGLSDEEEAKFLKYHEQLEEVGALWDVLKRKMMEPIAGTVSILMKWLVGDLSAGGKKYRLDSDGHLVQEGGAADTGGGNMYHTDAQGRLILGSTFANTPTGFGVQYSAADYAFGRVPRTGAYSSNLAPNFPEMADFASGQSMLKTDRAADLRTLSGATEELGKAQKTAKDAHDAYFGKMGTDTPKKDLDDLKTAWQTAAAAVTNYKSEIESLRSQKKGLSGSASEFFLSNPHQTSLSYIAGIGGLGAGGQNVGDISAHLDARGQRIPGADNAMYLGDGDIETLQKGYVERYLKGQEYLNKQTEDQSKESMKRSETAGKAWLDKWQAGDEQRREEMRAGIEKQASGIETGAGQQVQLATARHQLQMVGKEPDGEVRLAQQELDIRMKALDNELAIKAAHAGLFDMVKEQADYENRTQTAQFDFQLKILDLRKQIAERDQKDAEEFGKLVVDFSNAAETGGHRGISQFFRGQAHGVEDTLIGNVASTAFKNFGSSLIPHIPAGPFGDLFKGTPFSPKSSDQKLLSDATLDNTLATRDNTRAVEMSRSGGGGGFVPGGGGSGLDLTSGAWGSVGSAGGSGVDMSDPFNITGGGSGTAMFSPAALVSLGATPAVATQLSGMMALSAKLKTMGTAAGGFMGDVSSGMSDPLGILFGKDVSQGGNYTGTATVGQDVGAGVGIAAAGMGTYMGLAQIARGGGHNVAAGIGTSLMSVGGFMATTVGGAPAAPFVIGAGLAAEMVGLLMGDPRVARGTQISNFEMGAAYSGPDPVSYARSMSGGTVGTDMFGNSRAVGNTTNVTIHAMDPDSFNTFLQNHPTQLDNGLYNVIQNGSKSVPALRQTLLGG